MASESSWFHDPSHAFPMLQKPESFENSPNHCGITAESHLNHPLQDPKKRDSGTPKLRRRGGGKRQASYLVMLLGVCFPHPRSSGGGFPRTSFEALLRGGEQGVRCGGPVPRIPKTNQASSRRERPALEALDTRFTCSSTFLDRVVVTMVGQQAEPSFQDLVVASAVCEQVEPR